MNILFYNLVFEDDDDLEAWCKAYDTSKDVFDIIETDEDGKYHVVVDADCVPKYHADVCREVVAETEVNAEHGKRRNGVPKARANSKPRSKTKACRGQTADQLFLYR